MLPYVTQTLVLGCTGIAAPPLTAYEIRTAHL